MYACDNGTYRELADDGSYYVNYDELNTEIYFNALEEKGGPVSGQLIIKCLSDGSNDIETIIDKQWYLDDKLANLPTFEDSRLNPDPTLTMLIMDMSIVCQDSLFGRQKFNGFNDGISEEDVCSIESKISFYLKKKNEEGIYEKKIEKDMNYRGHIENKSGNNYNITNDIENVLDDSGNENEPNFEKFVFPTKIYGEDEYINRLEDFNVDVTITNGAKITDYKIEI
jgi:hypothetical protein